MTENEARNILDPLDESGIRRPIMRNDDSILSYYIFWRPGDETIVLDSEFTLEELEAIVWWMKNKNKPVSK